MHHTTSYYCCKTVLNDLAKLQGNVATHSRGGEKFYYRFTTNLLLSLSVNEF